MLVIHACFKLAILDRPATLKVARSVLIITLTSLQGVFGRQFECHDTTIYLVA